MNPARLLETRWSLRLQSAAVAALFSYFVYLDAHRFVLTYFPFFAFRAAFLVSIAVLYLHRTLVPADIRSSMLGRSVALVHSLFPVFISFNVAGKVGAAVITGVVAGMTISALALVDLWDSFSIAPANRGVKTGGMYRIVRHPMYLGYIISLWSVALAQATVWNVVICVVFLLLTLFRIALEERVLCQDEAYRDYRRRVRFRLLPLIL